MSILHFYLVNIYGKKSLNLAVEFRSYMGSILKHPFLLIPGKSFVSSDDDF